MATVYVDGRPVEMEDKENLLQQCLSAGLDIPYFCWHPALGAVGACRQCAVKQFADENDCRGKIVMACMTAVEDGLRIGHDDPEVTDFRAAVIEWLMVPHPHDCPVCDEGGECHLQDMTLLTGHVHRRYRYRKRTFRNQYLGPFVNHEMNRCIACYRCVRFYGDYAGGRDLQALASKNHVYFGRHEDGVLASEFAGNLVEVCPTGVFTDLTLKQHYTRRWDLQQAPSICVHCAHGCNIFAAERYGELRRIVNRYHPQVNGYFLCDRGRFGYQFVNGPERVRQVLAHANGEAQVVDPGEARKQLGALLAKRPRLIGIGSPRASLEANFALRTLVGPDNFSLGVAARDATVLRLVVQILTRGPVRTPTISEVETADAVLILGEDPSNTAPRLTLALRQSVRQRALQQADAFGVPSWLDASVRVAGRDLRSPLYIAAVAATRLDDITTESLHLAPDDIARLGYAIARQVGGQTQPQDTQRFPAAAAIAQALLDAERPLVVSGTSLRSTEIVQAAANIALALHKAGREARLSYVLPEANSLGLALLGGSDIETAIEAVEGGGAEAVVILENDLYRRLPATTVERLWGPVPTIALDAITTRTTARADWVLPAGSFAETAGTLISSEGRAQRYFSVLKRADASLDAWRWLVDLAREAGRTDLAWSRLDELTAACAQAIPALTRITEAAPSADLRLVGQRIPRQPHRYSGRTAMWANRNVHEPKPLTDPDSALAFTMEGQLTPPVPALLPFYWAPRWNSFPQALNKFQQEVGGPLRGGEPGVRLIEPGDGGLEPFAEHEAPAPAKGQHRVVPLYQVFGSEELSRLAPSIAELVPRAFIAMRPDEAAFLGLAPETAVELRLGADTLQAPLHLLDSLPPGTVGVPAGFAETAGLDLPAVGLVKPGDSA